MKNLKKVSLSIFILLFGLNIYAQELDDIVKEVSESIELDETQTKESPGKPNG